MRILKPIYRNERILFGKTNHFSFPNSVWECLPQRSALNRLSCFSRSQTSFRNICVSNRFLQRGALRECMISASLRNEVSQTEFGNENGGFTFHSYPPYN